MLIEEVNLYPSNSEFFAKKEVLLSNTWPYLCTKKIALQKEDGK